VANYSTGVSVAWNGITFQEVYSLSWSHGGERQDRGSGSSTGWTPSPGAITIGCYHSAGASTGNLGKVGAVSISGGGISASGNAVFESVNFEPELNGVTRYTITLKVLL